MIPLLLEDILSEQKFKDAKYTLTPAQRRFSTSYQKIKLKCSVFGVCIVPLQSQLEKLLNLPGGALTKEIKFMHDLTSLFVEYQTRSDLLFSDELPTATMSEKVDAVMAQVKQF